MKQPNARRRAAQPDDRPRDNRTLAEPGEHGFEELRPARARAPRAPASAGHDLERDDVVHLRPVAEHRAADAADAQRSADRQILIIRQRRRSEPAGQCAIKHCTPCRPRGDVGERPIDVVHACQRAHVDHDAGVDLRLTIDRMTLPTGRNADPQPSSEADQPDDVVDRSRLEHGKRTPTDDVTEVLGSRRRRADVGMQHAVEQRKAAREPTRPVRSRGPSTSRHIKADHQRARSG